MIGTGTHHNGHRHEPPGRPARRAAGTDRDFLQWNKRTRLMHLAQPSFDNSHYESSLSVRPAPPAGGLEAHDGHGDSTLKLPVTVTVPTSDQPGRRMPGPEARSQGHGHGPPSHRGRAASGHGHRVTSAGAAELQVTRAADSRAT